MRTANGLFGRQIVVARRRRAGPPRRATDRDAAAGSVQAALGAALDAFGDLVVLLSPDGHVLYLNQTAATALAGSADLDGAILWDVLAQPAGTPLRQACQRCLDARVPAEAGAVCAPSGRHYAARAFPAGNGCLLLWLRDTTEATLAAAALAAERARLAAVFAAAPVGLALFDDTLRYSLANEPLAVIDGVPATARIGRTLREILPEVADMVEPILRRVLDSGRPVEGIEIEGETAAAPGQRRSWLASYHPVLDAGRVIGVSAAVLEITDRKAIEASLRESEALLRLATVGAGVGTWGIDLLTGEVQLSAESQALFGTGGRPLTRETWLEPVHLDDRAIVLAEWQQALQNPGPYEAVFRAAAPAADGGERWLFSRGRMERNAAGAPLRGVGIMLDISARVRAERALRESEARFQAIANAAPVLIWIADTSKGCTWFNHAWLAFTGRSLEQERGYGWAEGVHPDDLDRCVATYNDAFDRRVPFRMDYRLRRADGEWRITDDTGVPRFTDDGVFLGYIGSVVDVTEARRAAAELRRLNETLEARIAERVAELAAANRQLRATIAERDKVEATMRQMQRLEAVGQITAGVAHDFNNLLAVILGNVDMLLAELKLRDSGRQMIDMTEQTMLAAERGAALTKQLLAFARRQQLDPRSVDLNEVVRGMRDLLQSSVGGFVHLKLALDPALWQAFADPVQVGLVILNLAINARDAMPGSGTLTIATANLAPGEPPGTPDLAAGEYVMVAVSDTGVGMTEAVRARAFEPFFTTKQVGKGSGLGLAQVYGFAKQSNGDVQIESAPGSGTTVRLFLPRATAAASDAVPRPRGHAAVRPAIAGGGRGRILVVDDDNAVRQVMAATLARSGYEIVTAASGAAALALLAREHGRIDLLVVDFAMPGMNGVEVAREARTMDPDLPVLFVTGYADIAALEGVDRQRIVAKPFREHELADKVAAIIGPVPAAEGR